MTIQYILESAFCLACLYGFYWLALQRETFFQWNRVYLLLSPILALGLPALKIQLTKESPAMANTLQANGPAIDLPVIVEQVQQAPVAVRHTLTQPVAEGWSVSLGECLWWIYLAGAGLLLIRLAIQAWYLLRMIRRCRKAQSGNVDVMVSDQETLPLASFFGFVLWNHENQLSEDQKLLLEHELVHVRQWHSLDVLLMEIMLIVQWFNPLMHAFRRSLCAVHEYIADDCVVRNTRQRYAYATLLVQHQKTGQRARPGLVNTFHSLIKHRLIMLAKRPSRPLSRAKYLLAIPLFATLMLLFSFRFIEKLPAAAPFMEAVKKADAFAGTLSEVTIIAEKIAPAEQTPYIFYWGAVQCRIMHDTGNDTWFGQADLSPEEFREAIKREPRIWNGKSLEQHLSLTIHTFSVKSDYNDESVYEKKRLELDNFIGTLQQHDYVELEQVSLPNGKTATIRLSFGAAVPGWLIREKAGSTNWMENPDMFETLPEISWGQEGAAIYDQDRQFYTLREFWSIVDTRPTMTLPPGAYEEMRGDTVTGVLPGGKVLLNRVRMMIVRPGKEISILSKMTDTDLSFDQVRESLELKRDLIAPETVVLFYWSRPGEPGQSWVNSKLMASFTLVPEGDPRLALHRSEQRDYRFEWGDFSATFMHQYARSFRLSENQHIAADRPLEVVNNALTARQVLRTLYLTPRLFENQTAIEWRNFTLDFNGYNVLVDKNGVPEEMVRRMESRLKPGDKVRITALQASNGVNLLNASIVLEIRSEDPKPPLAGGNASPLHFQWGDFSQVMRSNFTRNRIYREGDGDTVTYLTYSVKDVKKMLLQKPLVLEDDKPVKGLRFYVTCGSLGAYITDEGFPPDLAEKFQKEVRYGRSLIITGFSGKGMDLRGLTLSFFPYADDNPPKNAEPGKASPYAFPTELFLSIAPNPASLSEVVTIAFDLPKAAKATLIITNAKGQVLWNQTRHYQLGTFSENFGVEQLKSRGTFFATLETPYGKVSQQFVVE
jgi:hypothetical protein